MEHGKTYMYDTVIQVLRASMRNTRQHQAVQKFTQEVCVVSLFHAILTLSQLSKRHLSLIAYEEKALGYDLLFLL